ncbi:hypothetical protein CHS0354_018903 [Potamilus streckersoni]|uniref:Uncharacterized protein n=1 Tax=Potamilus streckersoni TaxID=2493646 RepID=A0AAE0SBX3_9BIVA|nr:hypothetical protein CHS0354_018903 [Potamilus streckersoni]
MTLANVLRFILLIWISSFIKAQGLCGEWGNLKEYGRNEICCDKKVVNRFDDKNQELGCCENELYYIRHIECVEGELVIFSQLEQAHPSTTQTPKGKPISRMCRARFVYRLYNITMTNSSDPKMTNSSSQKIWATVRVLSLIKLRQMAGTKWETSSWIKINVPQSQYSKYIGRNRIFVFSDKNLLRDKSLNLSQGVTIIKYKFNRKHIKRCSSTGKSSK